MARLPVRLEQLAEEGSCGWCGHPFDIGEFAYLTWDGMEVFCSRGHARRSLELGSTEPVEVVDFGSERE